MKYQKLDTKIYEWLDNHPNCIRDNTFYVHQILYKFNIYTVPWLWFHQIVDRDSGIVCQVLFWHCNLCIPRNVSRFHRRDVYVYIWFIHQRRIVHLYLFSVNILSNLLVFVLSIKVLCSTLVFLLFVSEMWCIWWYCFYSVRLSMYTVDLSRPPGPFFNDTMVFVFPVRDSMYMYCRPGQHAGDDDHVLLVYICFSHQRRDVRVLSSWATRWWWWPCFIGLCLFFPSETRCTCIAVLGNTLVMMTLKFHPHPQSSPTPEEQVSAQSSARSSPTPVWDKPGQHLTPLSRMSSARCGVGTAILHDNLIALGKATVSYIL